MANAPKEYYRIGEVSDLLGVKPHVLRYWEKEFDVFKPQKAISGHRVFSEKDIKLLKKIKYLLYEKGYTIEGAKKQLKNDLRLEELREKLDIKKMKSDLEEMLKIISN